MFIPVYVSLNVVVVYDCTTHRENEATKFLEETHMW